MVLLGSTDSPGGSTAVIRYGVSSAITVLAADSPPPMSLAEVQAAAQPSISSSTGAATTPDMTSGDLSPLDGTGEQDPLHKRSASRPSVVSGASPPTSSAGLVTATS